VVLAHLIHTSLSRPQLVPTPKGLSYQRLDRAASLNHLNMQDRDPRLPRSLAYPRPSQEDNLSHYLQECARHLLHSSQYLELRL